jgi:hypothetical protein
MDEAGCPVQGRLRIKFESGQVLAWGCALSHLRFAHLKSESRNLKSDRFRFCAAGFVRFQILQPPQQRNPGTHPSEAEFVKAEDKVRSLRLRFPLIPENSTDSLKRNWDNQLQSVVVL